MKKIQNSIKSKNFRKLFLLSSFSVAFYGNMYGLGGILMTSFLLYLGANARDIGILAALPSLTNLLQVLSIRIYEKAKSRKKVVIFFTIFQYIFFYLIIIIPKITTGHYQIILLIVCFLFGHLFRAMKGSGILEWNNFFVPAEIKGKYYSNKNLFSNLVYIMTSLIVGKILDVYADSYSTYLVLFLITAVFSIIEVIGYVKIDDYNEDLIVRDKTKFRHMLLLPLKNKTYRYFMIFSLSWFFARSMAMPYYTFYSKIVLNLDYMYIALIGSITGLIKMFVANPFGNLGDKKGWRRTLQFMGLAFAFTNIMWGLINEKSLVLYPFVIILTGIFMIGTNIAIFNLNIELSSSKNRLLFFGFNASLTAIFSFVGPNLASFLMDKLRDVNINIFNMNVNGYQIVFFISGILQGIAIFVFAIYLKSLEKSI